MTKEIFCSGIILPPVLVLYRIPAVQAPTPIFKPGDFKLLMTFRLCLGSGKAWLPALSHQNKFITG
jgi:hypothetical protein